jgi:hypothetical protein
LPGLPFAFISLVYFIEKNYLNSKKKIVGQAIIAFYIITIILWSLVIQLPPYITF